MNRIEILEKQIKEQAIMIKSLQDEDQKKLKEIKFVNVFFDLNKYKKGQDIINTALNDGFEITTKVQTEAGLVYCLGRYNTKTERKDRVNINE